MAIYKQDLVDINLETGNIHRSFLNHSIGYMDNNADKFGVRVFRDNNPVDLSGVSCQAIFMTPDGRNIALTSYGTVSENVAYVTLPQACYDVEGQFCLAIKLIGDGVTGTMRIVDGVVSKTGASGTIAPTGSVPTYQEVLSVYEQMVDAVEEFDDYKDQIDAEVADIKRVIVDSFGRIDQVVPNMDYAFSIEWEEGGIDDSGEDYESDYWMRMTGYIPLKTGEMLDVVVDGSEGYDLRRALYESDYTLVSSLIITVTGDTRSYKVVEGVSFARFAIPKSVFDAYNVSIFKDYTYNSNFSTVEKRQERVIDSLKRIEQAIPNIDYASVIDWEQGGIDDSGEEYESDYWVRMSGYFSVKPGQIVRVVAEGSSGFSLRRVLYKSDQSLLSSLVISVTGETRDYSVVSDAAYARFAVQAGEFEAHKVKIFIVNDLDYNRLKITSKAAVNKTVFMYNGDELDMSIPKSYRVTELFNAANIDAEPTGKTGQAFAIYKGSLFQFFADDLCRVYDINTGILLAELTGTTGHGNSACFSNAFYSGSDTYPMIYVSDTNGKVRQMRIGGTSISAVKTLYFDPTQYGYTAQFAIDNDNNVGYTVGNASDDDSITTAVISSWNMNQLTDNGDGTYTPQLIDTFMIDVSDETTEVVLQGVKYKNGLIFMPSGGTSSDIKSIIHVIDIGTESISAKFSAFPETLLVHELEDIDFLPNLYTSKYDLVVHIRSYGYYRIML